MPYDTQGFNEFVDNVERVVLEQIKDARPSMVRSLYSEVPWNEGDGEKVTFNSVCLSPFIGRVTENEEYPIVNPEKGNELSKTQQQYGGKINITRRMMKFNKRYPNAKFDAKALIKGLNEELDLEMTVQAFNEVDQTTATFNGQDFTSNIATSDSKAVAATDHSYGGIEFSNVLSGAGSLGIENLAAAQTHGNQNTPDDYGTYISPQWDTLVIADSDMKMKIKAHQMFGSKLSPESGTNAVNFYGGEGSMKVIGLKYGDRTNTGAIDSDLANVYRWMIMDSDMARRAWQLQVAEDPTTEQKFTDHDNLLAKLLVTQFAAFAIVQPQGTVYSLATEAPTLT